MKSKVWTWSALILTAALGAASAAEITGKIKLKGTPPAEKTVIEAEAMCGSFMKKKPLTTRHYVVGQESGLGNVFVYIKEGAQPAAPTGPGPVLDQVDCEYTPYVLGVQTGQKFSIRNSDPILHNVHATPKVNKEFNFAQPLKGQVNERVFDQPEIMVRMKCDVHAWMFAYIGVVNHPYYAVTDKDGNFKISNVPAGKYTLEVVHLKAGRATQDVTLAADDKKALNFELSVPAP